MFNYSARRSLSHRIIAVILICMGIISVAQVAYTEWVLEQAILLQTKSQVVIFLQGLEREVRREGIDSEPEKLLALLREGVNHDKEFLNFAVNSLYIYDHKGVVLAHTQPGIHPAKDLEAHYGDVLRQGIPYLGGEVEWEEDSHGNLTRPKIDIIIPVHQDGEVVAGIEAELDLAATVQIIKSMDDRFERDFVIMVLLGMILIFIAVWVAMHRGLVAPMLRLGNITHQIAEGDLSARVASNKMDEIGFLGQAIDRMADSIEQLIQEMEQASLGMMQSLAKALEAKDAYTAGHSGRVTHYSVRLGKHLNLNEAELKLLRQGALMHDLGKIGIADSILNKPAPLDEREFEVMRSHPELTANIMRPLKRFKEFTDIASWHHERWDGKGYPDGLQGEEIPLLARIVSIADTWDAMTGDRVYRKGMGVEKALSILESEQDSGQWDPKLLKIFIKMIQDERQQLHFENPPLS
ncbi:MAG: HD domain-containing protein [Gammaproteobacteria bacterium]|nr:HD domain-containing protein [Gammaproteobacteria bacterium]